MAVLSVESVARWSGGVWSPAPPARIAGVFTDTRDRVRDGLFFALQGPRFDAHDFVRSALAAGAAGAVVRRDRAAGLSGAGPLLCVDDPEQALRDIAAGHRRASRLDIVAVTGSTGKTTVKEMTADALAAALPTIRTPGNLNNQIGIPLSLLAIEPEHRVGVFEAGISHPGEMEPLARLLEPQWVIVTNVGPVHIEYFASVAAIAREKAGLIRAAGPGGVAVLCRDGECFEVLRAEAPGRVVTVSVGGDADYACASCRYDAAAGGMQAEVVERDGGARVPLFVPLPGRHHVVNALMASAVARGHGVSWDAIVGAIRRYRTLAMRWEEREAGGVRIVNDGYNANPVSMRAAVEAFRLLEVRGRKWLVLGGMLELGSGSDGAHAALGRALVPGEWAGLIAVGPQGRLIAGGAREAGLDADRIVCCADPAEAGLELRRRAAPGDAALLKASRGIRIEGALRALDPVAGAAPH